MQGCQTAIGFGKQQEEVAEESEEEQEGNGELWVVIYTDCSCYSPLVCVAGHYRDSDCDDVAYD